MNINPDDPKWTAYVLGELNESERAQVEQELEVSALAREVVEEIRLATGFLKSEFAREASVELTPKQRGVVAAAASSGRSRPVFRWAAAVGLAAAGVLIVVGVFSSRLSRFDVGVSAPQAPSQTKGERPADGSPIVEEARSRDTVQPAANASQVRQQRQELESREDQLVAQAKESAQVQNLLKQQNQQGQQGQQSKLAQADAEVLPGAAVSFAEKRQVGAVSGVLGGVLRSPQPAAAPAPPQPPPAASTVADRIAPPA